MHAYAVGADVEHESDAEAQLMIEWFELINERNALVRREEELRIR